MATKKVTTVLQKLQTFGTVVQRVRVPVGRLELVKSDGELEDVEGVTNEGVGSGGALDVVDA